MKNWQPSDSEQAGDQQSSAFDLLSEGVQRWIWQKNWQSLRLIQEQAARPILSADRDVVIGAPTAGGKTEAAFLPIVTQLAKSKVANATCICISPLKALINDQYDRLVGLCDSAGVNVCRWHGDAPESQKKQFLKKPLGVLLITPESLEAHLVRGMTRVQSLFGGAQYFLVDELHAFIGNERGKQLQSLLHRLDLAIGRFVPRVALSATLGDMRMAAEFLRPGHGEKALLLNDSEDGRELQLLLRGTLAKAPVINADKEPDDAAVYSDKYDIARYMFKVLRGKDNLIFANRRQDVEFFADLLRRHCEQIRVPNEFLPHHGSLSKELREHAEQRLKDKDKPASVVATTTLEMGIDVGSVSSIAQIGNPPSVAAMKQRLGRSGRRKGEPAVMRAFISEQEIDQRSSPQDMLRAQTVQAAAMVELMLKGWSEPPELRNLHLSTLIQQLLSVIAQLGGVRADHAWKLLCGTGPFPAVDQSDFVELLRVLGKRELLTQAGDGTLVLGVAGEQLVDHYDFYAAFFASKEFQLLHDGRSLGSLPISNPVMAGTHLIFGGRRWTVIAVDVETSVILVKPSEGGRPPMFDGGAAMVHDRVREQMRTLYTSDVVPSYADATARDFIAEGRAYFRSAGLVTQPFLEIGDRTYLFPWAGDRVMVTLESILCAMGLEVSNGRIVLEVRTGLKDLQQCIRTILTRDPPSATELAKNVKNRILGKYDHLLSEGLQCKNYASAMLDVPASLKVLQSFIK